MDLSRNFFVVDDKSFELAWSELRDRWERNIQRRERRRQRQPSPAMPLPAGRPPSQRPDGSVPPLKRLRGMLRVEAKRCSVLAREDVRSSLCASYEQALAVRLVLVLGADAAIAMAELCPGAAEGGEENRPLKRLARLIHPDKTAHPSAK